MPMIINNADLDYQIDTNGQFTFTEGGPLLLLDADPIAYSAASACESAQQVIRLKGVAIYTIDGGKTELYNSLGFQDYREFNTMLEKNPDITHEIFLTADDPINMCHTIKAQVKRIIKQSGAGSVRLFLTDGASNFRLTEEIATVLKYKGNRKPDAKPQLLGEARKYMMEELGAELCIGLEADDQLAILHNEAWDKAMSTASARLEEAGATYVLRQVEELAMELSDTVLATIDKDIKMVAGNFINPDQDLGIEQIFPMGYLNLEIKVKAGKPDSKKLRFAGLKGFYAQLLLGDSCDNISGVYFCGDVRVNEVLAGCETEEALFKATLEEIYHGFHREHIKALDAEITSRVAQAISMGEKDTKSNITKLRSKFKALMDSTVSFMDKHYYHWDEYLLKEDGTVSNDLANPETATVLKLTPVQYLTEVARLIFMLKKQPNEDGSHLWQVPNQKWVESVEQKFRYENLTRIPTPWDPI